MTVQLAFSNMLLKRMDNTTNLYSLNGNTEKFRTQIYHFLPTFNPINNSFKDTVTF